MKYLATFYHFTSLQEPQKIRDTLYEICASLGVKGTILLADEGINGSVAGSANAIVALTNVLRAIPDFEHMKLKSMPVDDGIDAFYRLKVLVKREIVSMGMPAICDANFDYSALSNAPSRKNRDSTNEHLSPEDWNTLLRDNPDLLLLDVRNRYEISIGSFQGSTDLGMEVFREFPDLIKTQLKEVSRTKPVAMFCTGGIRCEKASELLLHEGFKNVYQLDGGILHYLKVMHSKDSLWRGDCFVFDNRVALSAGLKLGQYVQCFACRLPLSPEALKHPDYVEGVSCHYCADVSTDKQKSRFAQRQYQQVLAKRRGQKHIGCSQS